MGSEDKFWLGTWAIVGTFLVALTASITFYNIYEVKAIRRMVVSGADPIAAACSVRHMDAAICATQVVLTAK